MPERFVGVPNSIFLDTISGRIDVKNLLERVSFSLSIKSFFYLQGKSSLPFFASENIKYPNSALPFVAEFGSSKDGSFS